MPNNARMISPKLRAAAEQVYRADLVRHPNNAWSLLGLQQSLAHLGRTEEAAALAEQVDAAWSRADVITPTASCYCHPEARGGAEARCECVDE